MSLPSMRREQEAQRVILELILRNQHAMMAYFIRTSGEIPTAELQIMLKATGNWLSTEATSHLEV